MWTLIAILFVVLSITLGVFYIKKRVRRRGYENWRY